MLEARITSGYNPEQEGVSLKLAVTQRKTSDFQKSDLVYGKLSNDSSMLFKFPVIQENVAREWEGLVIAHRAGVSVPTPLGQLEREEDPRLGLAMEFVDGRSLVDDTNPDIRYKLGHEVRKMHEIRLSAYGIQNEEVPIFKTEADFDNHWLSLTLPFIPEGEGKGSLVNILYDGDSKRNKSDARFLHRDLNSSNVIIRSDNSVCIIDFEWWQGGNPMDDLGGYRYHALRTSESPILYQAFEEGYFNGKPVPDLDKKNILFYTLLSAFRVVRFSARTQQSRVNESIYNLNRTIDYIKPLMGDY